jgi:hypothetical protein
MKQRPLLFIILGILHLIEPLSKILFFRINTHFPIDVILSNVLQISGLREIFEFWFLFPIGGLALLGVKKWSYPVFVGVQAYSLLTHLTYKAYTWPYVDQVPQWPSLVLLMCNIGIIIYFALPDVRRPFFDSSIRWWEPKERISLKLPCTLNLNIENKLIDAEILNISHSGAFIKYDERIENLQSITVNICINDMALSLKSVIISKHSFKGQQGLGVKFVYTNIWENLYMRKMIKAISKDDTLQKPEELAA